MCFSGLRQVLYSNTPTARLSGILCKDESFTLLDMDILSTKKEKLVNLDNIIDIKRFCSYLKLPRVTSCSFDKQYEE